MRILVLAILTTVLAVGCDQGKTPPAAQPAPPAPPTRVEAGGPQGGIHVNDPAGGTKVDVDGSGVHVKTPETRVDTK